MQTKADWIAVDWGTTNLRAWIVGARGEVIERLDSETGFGTLAPNEIEQFFLALVAPYLDAQRTTTVIACGMVGAREGWAEAVYAAVPCPPPGADRATRVATADARIDVYLLPGLCQDRPADVMRGEETQIGGFLIGNPGFDGTICLPGTHAKWVRVSAGEIIGFRTFMTGDLFSAISAHTVLRHSVGQGDDKPAFVEAVAEGLANPKALSARLFEMRAEGLLHGLPAAIVSARLSGLLIGLELAGARGYWLGMNVALVGGSDLCARYARALETQGVTAAIADGDAMVFAGLKAAQAQMTAKAGRT